MLNPPLVAIEISDTPNLIDRAQSGDAEAFSELCHSYETRLLRQAMALCRNQSLAEDLAQDTLVEAWRCQLFTWFCAILLNRYRNTTREKRPLSLSTLKARDQDQFQQSVDSLVDHDSPPDQAAQHREQSALVWECINALPIKQRQVVYLRFYVDDSLESIAAALGCSMGTVKSRLYHALDKLRAMNAMNDQTSILKPKAGII